MSGQSDNEFVLKGLTHGAVDYMLKPLQFEELRYIWQHAVRSRHIAATAAAKPSSSGEKASASEERERPDGPAGASQPPAAKESERPQRKTDGRKRKEQPADDRDDDTEVLSSSAPLAPACAFRFALHVGVQHQVGSLTSPVCSSTPQPPDEEAAATGAKKPRVVWSVDLHQQFVNAVNSLGIDKAVPKRILDLMGVEARRLRHMMSDGSRFPSAERAGSRFLLQPLPTVHRPSAAPPIPPLTRPAPPLFVQGLTRENVASHLQKYRLYLKRIQVPTQPNRQSGIIIAGARCYAGTGHA